MSRGAKILLIDDDQSLCKVVSHQLSQSGFAVATAFDGETGLARFREESFEVVLTDLALPDQSGMSVLREIRRINREVVVIIITAFGTVDNAIEACRLGADDYVTKPFGREQLLFVIEKALRLRQLQSENRQLRSELRDRYRFERIIAKSGKMEEVLKMAARVAETDATVLILGESGTGKELLAQAIHYNSPRSDRPLVTVNCPSIPENLLESELFGHVKGAFTGAIRDRKGKFELAEGGTLFLDEIGDLPEHLQAKLLRVLQEREIERLGDTKPIHVDVRILAATNKDLARQIQTGRFREDLYYRLSVVTIVIPPLREHPEDIPFLVDYFLQKHGHGRRLTVSEQAMKFLLAYPWPGNVRELENTIERATIFAPGSVITPEALPPGMAAAGASASLPPLNEPSSLEEIERQAIRQALEKSRGNQTGAAQLLKVPRHVLRYRMKKLGLV